MIAAFFYGMRQARCFFCAIRPGRMAMPEPTRKQTMPRSIFAVISSRRKRNAKSGAIIGLRGVVGRDVAPYAIVAGNPAREIRKRFDDELIQLMLKLKWWDRPVEDIQRLIPLLSCGDLARVRAELAALLEE